jgi:hypothetical protein
MILLLGGANIRTYLLILSVFCCSAIEPVNKSLTYMAMAFYAMLVEDIKKILGEKNFQFKTHSEVHRKNFQVRVKELTAHILVCKRIR